MRLTAIEIQNFRQYQNLSLTFPKTTEHDLHVIVAENGVGKTNILNAITWCLYGEEFHLGDSSKSLPRFNLKAREEAVDRGEDYVTVSVRISADDDGASVLFCRSMDVVAETSFEKKCRLTVMLPSGAGDTKVHEDAAAEAYIERYMPKKIREYFYFDGEQLDKYFISENSTKIQESIRAISQVDMVGVVKERLGKVIQKKQSEAGKKAPNIQALNDEAARIDKCIEDYEKEIRALEEQIATSDAVIKTNTERLSGQENLPELEARYQSLRAAQTRLEAARRECYSALFAFVRRKKIALSFYPSAKATLELIREKEEQNALPPNIDREMLRALLSGSVKTCPICDGTLDRSAMDHIEELLDRIQVSSETSNTLMRIRSELERTVAEAESYPREKKDLLARLRAAEDELEQCGTDLQAVDREINTYQDKAQVRAWHEERKTHQELFRLNSEKRAVAEYRLQQARSQREAVEQKRQKELTKAQECARLNQLITFASRARDVVAGIEAEMMDEVRARMERRTMEYFSRLIWKQGVYDHITLDERYQLDLIHRDGYSCVGSCSAAERSLLALSFTLALHEVSGFNSLLFIDTPVSRVSSQNRVNFADVLKEVSRGKQLIMAFTPDEYSENISRVFEPIASTSAHLAMNDSNDITNIDSEVRV